MRSVGGLISAAAIGLALPATPTIANPWAIGQGQGQAILKAEPMTASEGFDPDGVRRDLPAERRDTVFGVFAQYGMTDALTLQIKGDWQSGRDAFVDYEGRGPIEVGVWWQAWRDDRWAVGAYVGYADGGEGRNAGYAAPGQGDEDVEVRLGVGRTLAEVGGRWGPDRAFINAQAARRVRAGLPDETRVDLTLGGHFGEDWMVLAQGFGGLADGDGPRWLNLETSVVRQFGGWSIQAGWRETLAGRETPIASGPVLGVWRRF